MDRAITPALVGECDTCHNPGTLIYTNLDGKGNYMCAECHVQYILACATADHLQFLLGEAIRVWLPHWKHLPYARIHGLDEVGQMGEQAMEAVLSETDEAAQ